MKIINKKIVMLFSVILLLSIAAFSTITLLFADEENSIEENDVKLAATNFQQGWSMIDYIIETSNDSSDVSAQTYQVVELYSGSTPSALSDMCDAANKTFEEQVFNGNKSSAQPNNFNPGKIRYQGFSLAEANDPATSANVKAAIEQADFLYVSEDPSSPWTATNDIRVDEIREAINTYISDSKPIVFDSHNLTMQNIVNGDKTVEDVANQYWSVEGNLHATFMWPHDMAINIFMDPAEMSATFVPSRGDIQKANVWVPVTRDDPSAVPDPHTTTSASQTITEYIGRILVIHNSSVAGDTHLTDKIKASFSGAYDFTGGTFDTSLIDTTKETLVLDQDSDLYKYGYYGRYDRPTAIQFEYLDMHDPAEYNAIAHVDYSKYDFVLVEPSTKDVEIGSTIGTADDVYASLVAAMTSGEKDNGPRVLYDSTLVTNPGGNNSTSELLAVNIAFLYRKIATTTDVNRYEYVLITTRERMNIYAQATTGRQVKDIARIINAGSFRGNSGPSDGDSSTVYTVLEIEPCYPIDTTLATALNPVKNFTYAARYGGGNVNFQHGADMENLYNNQYKDSYYYIRTDSVLSNTSDEISYGGTQSLTTLLENPTALSAAITQGNINNVNDYYKWRISKAKIAHATGRSFDQLNVVHMSSTEFATSRKTLLDNYDAIYIGGDHSAIKDIDKWYAKQNGYKCYNMYFHNGDMYTYSANYNDKDGTYGVFSGNDLTATKLEELTQYAKAKGMPVILDKDVCDAYMAADSSSSVYNANQTLLDPESNMFKFIRSVTDYDHGSLVSTGRNVVVNFESNNTYKAINNAEEYGKTKEGFATVFLGEVDPTDAFTTGVTGRPGVVGEKQLGEALNDTCRPLIFVTRPTAYNDEDESTWIDPDSIKDDGLKWSVSCSTPAKINLYIDDNSNGKFEESEGELVTWKNASQANKPVTLNFKPQSDYYGVVYWKIEAQGTNGLSCSTTGCCKIKRTTQSKMYVNLLQIMPGCGETSNTGTSREASLRTLFLCTECQFAKARLNGNRYTPTGVYYAGLMGGENTFYDSDIAFVGDTSSIVNNIHSFDSTYTYTGKNNGSHTHDFGIVKYDSMLQLGGTDANHTGVDDVESNWFDVIRKDYDVDTTIMYTSEVDARISEVENDFAGKTEQEVTNKITGSGGYAEKYNTYLNYYNAMKAVLNGYVEGSSHSYHTVTGTTVTVDFDQIDADFQPRAGRKFTEAMDAAHITKPMMTEYANASYKMDDLLTNSLDQFQPDKDTKASGYFGKIVAAATNSEINRDMRKYYDVFNAYNDANAISNRKLPQTYCDQYVFWRDANILKNFFFDSYQKYLWYSSYDYNTKRVDLDKVYSCIAIGAAEHFGGNQTDSDLSEATCDALLDYIAKDGNLILFHDSLNSNKEATKIMTRKLSSAFGQNARHQDDASKYPGSTYYLSSFGGSPSLSPRMLSLKGRYIDYNVGQFGGTTEQNLMYKYSSFTSQTEEVGLNNTRIGSAAHHMRNMIDSANEVKGLPTDKAKRANEGIITMYPFKIDKDLQIGATTPQGYAIDAEDEDMVVYYSLVGGTQGTNSSLFAADPMDGINNYFLYQYGSITYTGAGHGLLTGYGRENNDERKLFINCIVNAGKKSARGSSLNLYDLDSTRDLVSAGKANKYVVPFSGEDADYYMEIEDMSDFHGFDFLASIPTSSELKHVKIYYDLNHTSHITNDGSVYSYDSSVDKLILDSDKEVHLDSSGDIIEDSSVDGNLLKSVKAGITHMLSRADGSPMINLKEDCFDPGTNNQYAYIVVQVESGNGSNTTMSSAVLRLQFKPALNDLN